MANIQSKAVLLLLLPRSSQLERLCCPCTRDEGRFRSDVRCYDLSKSKNGTPTMTHGNPHLTANATFLENESQNMFKKTGKHKKNRKRRKMPTTGLKLDSFWLWKFEFLKPLRGGLPDRGQYTKRRRNKKGDKSKTRNPNTNMFKVQVFKFTE